MKRTHTTRRNQPRLGNGKTRDPLPSCVDPRVREAVVRDSIRWNTSRSWIIATALAAFYGIDIVTAYPTRAKLKRAS